MSAAPALRWCSHEPGRHGAAALPRPMTKSPAAWFEAKRRGGDLNHKPEEGLYRDGYHA